MNDDRRRWARHALAAYREHVHGDVEFALGDLLGDLHHLADRADEFGLEGLQSWDEAMGSHDFHYPTEVEEDED